jgi:hypothetical protein
VKESAGPKSNNYGNTKSEVLREMNYLTGSAIIRGQKSIDICSIVGESPSLEKAPASNLIQS